MEDLFLPVEAFFTGQISRAIFISTLVGAMMVLFGLILIGISWLYRNRGEAVMIKVISIKEEERRREGETSGILLRPEFLIESGASRGVTLFSSSASSHCKHVVGEFTQGYYFPSRDEIASAQQLKAGTKFGMVFILAGLVTMIVFRLYGSF